LSAQAQLSAGGSAVMSKDEGEDPSAIGMADGSITSQLSFVIVILISASELLSSSESVEWRDGIELLDQLDF
jgi:hypothetical protein